MTGEPGKTETTLTSEPTLPEPDIMALLVTGRTLDEMRGEEYEVAREQVLSYLAGRVASRLGRGLERATGLSEVRIEPQLIANEADPTARLTVGQELTDESEARLLDQPRRQQRSIWVAEYDVTRRFQTRACGRATTAIASISVTTCASAASRRRDGSRGIGRRSRGCRGDDTPAAEAPELRERFKVKEGDAYDFFAVRRGVERDRGALPRAGLSPVARARASGRSRATRRA